MKVNNELCIRFRDYLFGLVEYIVFSLSLILLGGIYDITFRDSALAGSSLFVEEPMVNLGDRLHFLPLYHQFELSNRGREPLIIENIKTSCGCVSELSSGQVLAPGSEGWILIGYEPKGDRKRIGAQSFTTTFSITGSVTKEVTLQLKVNLRKPVEVSPGRIEFARDSSQNHHKEIEVSCLRDGEIPNILSVTTSSPGIRILRKEERLLISPQIDVEEILDWEDFLLRFRTEIENLAGSWSRRCADENLEYLHGIVESVAMTGKTSYQDKWRIVQFLNRLLESSEPVLESRKTDVGKSEKSPTPLSVWTTGHSNCEERDRVILNRIILEKALDGVLRPYEEGFGRVTTYSIEADKGVLAQDMRGHLLVQTDSSRNPLIEIPIVSAARVKTPASMKAIPATALIGRVDAGAKKSVTVRLDASTHVPPGKYTAVPGDDRVQASIKERSDADGGWDLNITVSAGIGAGKLKTSVEVRSETGVTVVEVPVYAVIMDRDN